MKKVQFVMRKGLHNTLFFFFLNPNNKICLSHQELLELSVLDKDIFICVDSFSHFLGAVII